MNQQMDDFQAYSGKNMYQHGEFDIYFYNTCIYADGIF